MRLMAENPFPKFADPDGQPVLRVKNALLKYEATIEKYLKLLLRLSSEQTDCVGEAKSRPNEIQIICDAMPAVGGAP